MRSEGQLSDLSSFSSQVFRLNWVHSFVSWCVFNGVPLKKRFWTRDECMISFSFKPSLSPLLACWLEVKTNWFLVHRRWAIAMRSEGQDYLSLFFICSPAVGMCLLSTVL